MQYIHCVMCLGLVTLITNLYEQKRELDLIYLCVLLLFHWKLANLNTNIISKYYDI